MSDLPTILKEYLGLRLAVGNRCREYEHLLPQFVEFAQKEGAPFVTTDLALRWAMLPAHASPNWWANRLGVVRRFARFASAIDSRTEVPPDGLLPPRVRRKEPYLYSQAEIVDLIHAATKIRSRKGLRAKTYPTLFGLLAVSGMRLSEPLALDRDDVDLARGMLTIRRTKFRKSRLVPIHPTTCRVLKRYARERDRIHPRPATPAFFLSDSGVRLTQWAVRWTFVSISRQVGLRGPSDRTGPRLHDLRHAFALRTVLDWYRRGVDVERRMPVLATYLGHVHVADTYWYLTAAPELLRWAAKRVEGRRGGHQP